MFLVILLIVAGLALVVLGADFLVDGATAIARKFKVSEFVIGLTIVGFGTSCPELVVSVTGALQGNSDVALGNVLGSNIFNIIFILGFTALVSPIAITGTNKKVDIPLTMCITALFCALVLFSGTISRAFGIVFLVLFAAYMVFCFKSSDKGEAEEADAKRMPLFPAILLTLGGLAALVFGGQLFVDNATDLARRLGVSDKFIAVTLLAGGTSLPEFATCIVAAAKKKGQLALGNILGSCVFNILLILGCAAVIHPLDCSGLDKVDLSVLMLSTILLFTSSFTGKKNLVDRFDGSVMLAVEAAYLVWLFIS